MNNCDDNCTESDDCGFSQAYNNAYYAHLLANAKLQPLCLPNKPFSTNSLETNISIRNSATASSYPISFVINNNCSRKIKHVCLFINNLTISNFTNLGIALVNPIGQGAILFYNPNVNTLAPTNQSGGTTYPSQPPVSVLTPLQNALEKVNVTFSDIQSNLIPWQGQSGIFAPNVLSSPSFSSPCPSISASNELSIFDTFNSQGLWKLYIQNFGTGIGKIESAKLTLYYN